MTGLMAPPIEIENIGGGLADEVHERSGASPMRCYQCAKCSSGCPVADGADRKPHELVRMVQTDQRQAVLTSRFIWACTSCHTCTTRCPQQVDIAGMIDALREMSRRAAAAAPATAVPVFNEIFLDAVRERGRIFELGLMLGFKLRTRRLFEDVDKAPMMLLKGKLPLSSPRVAGKDERDALFGRAAATTLEAGAATTLARPAATTPAPPAATTPAPPADGGSK